MRIVPAVLLAVCLAGCNRGSQSTDAIRQGVIDRLSEAGLNVAGMDVTVTSVQINGKQADAAVSITAKGGNAAQGMQMKYHLEQKDNKWVVVGRQDGGGHGGQALPAGAIPPERIPGGGEPHAGAAMPTPETSGKMPAPEDLPPAGKKK